MRKSPFVVPAAVLTLALCLAGPGRAQVVNYGDLEEMFGEPITTSATGSPQRAADVPVNMEIISAADIRRSGADNIPDVLRFVAGVDVRQYGMTDSNVAVRGYNAANSPRVLVLLNGRQIYVDYHSYTAWATLPCQLEEIRQIEVIKGPNTALFGFNAIGGVINIVTYDPIFDSVNQVTARGGTQDSRHLSAVATVHSDTAGLRLSASSQGSRELPSDSLPPSYVPFPDRNTNGRIYAHGRANLPAGIKLSAEADVTRAKQLEFTVGGYPGLTTYASNRQKIGVGAATSIGQLDLNATRNWVEFRYLPGENCASCTSIVNSLAVVQVSDLFKPGVDHTVRLGLEYRNNRGWGSAYSGANLGFDVYAANAMWNWQATRDLALTNSVRLDHMTFTYAGPVAPGVIFSEHDYNSRPITEPSFNSAAVYKPGDGDTVRLSVGRGVQAPDFYALFPEPIQPGFNGFVNSYQGTPNLHPTVTMNYELAYSRAVPAIASTAQIAVFHQTSRDLIGPPGDAGVTDADANGYAGNIGNSTATGGELSLKGFSASGWRWKAAYALARVRDGLSVNQDVDAPDSSVDNQRGNPVHAVILSLGKTWGDWEVDVAGRWQSHFDDIAIGQDGTSLARVHINNTLTVNGRVGYTVNERITVAVAGQQLNRSHLIQTAGPPLERRVLGTLAIRF
jgi:iron complex outermembrane receptor protein